MSTHPSTAHLNSSSADRALTETYETLRELGDTIRRLDEQADEARRVAHLLEAELVALQSAFNPVRALHTSQTWTGQAATASRQRLDDHDARCVHARRSLDDLIDDLRRYASISTRRSNATRDVFESAQRDAAALEHQLGRFDDVFI